MEDMGDLWEGLPPDRDDMMFIITSPDLNYHVLAAPALEVFSVRISPNSFAQGKTCEVYGSIDIEDANGNFGDIYRRESDDAEIVSEEDNSLSVCMSSECAVSNAWGRMRISLKDKADNSVIVEDVFSLDTMTEDFDYDRPRFKHVPGVGGFASVSYGVLQTAVMASLDITFVSNHKSDGPRYADLYGKIVARYGNTYGKRYPEMMLFKKMSNQFTRAVSGVSFEFSRDLIVVPAYGFLAIELDLWDHHTNCQVVKGKVEFIAEHMDLYSEKIQAQDFLVKVEVNWFHPYTEESNVEQELKRRKMMHTHQLAHPTLSIRSNRSLPFGFPFAEVFTVTIGPNSRSAVSVYGQMIIRDNLMVRRLLDTDAKSPETLSERNRTISILGPCQSLDGPEDLAMFLDLKDVEGRMSILGNIVWGPTLLNWPISWYDRRLCSVLRGVFGYAVVHYMLFRRAVQAVVKVSFVSSSSPDVSHDVHGTIVARYGNHDYSTEYEKAYYQSILFKKPREHSSKLTTGCTIPLLKSVVTVPIDTCLILEVDLYASSSSSGFPEERITTVAEFQIDLKASVSPPILRKNYDIEFSIEWSRLDFSSNFPS